MADILITRQHDKGPEEARKIAERVADKLKRDFDMETRWEGETLHFERSGVTGALEMKPTEVQISAKLGLMLKPLKGRISQEIESFLDASLR